jgi:hypothetical protein
LDSIPTRKSHVLFLAMRTAAPEALAALRDGPDDRKSIDAWAKTHRLKNEDIIENAHAIRQFWNANPERAAALRWVTVMELRGTFVPRPPLLVLTPNPDEKTLRQWLRRAADAYREHSLSHQPRNSKRPAKRTPEIFKHAVWFIDVQVNGVRPSEVAKRAKVDRAAVERATQKVAKQFGLVRRSWSMGRPVKEV